MARKDRYGFKGVKSLDDVLEIERSGQSDGYPQSFYHGLVDSVYDNADEPALSFFMLAADYKKPITYTYSEVLAEVNQLSNTLHGLGVTPNDPIAIILPNMPEACFALVAAQTAGIAFPINPLLDKEQILELLNNSKAKVIITIGHFVKTDVWEKVDAIRSEAKLVKHIIKVDLGKYLLGIKKPIVKWICALKNKENEVEGQEVWQYEELKQVYTHENLGFERDVIKHPIAAYFHTGGTTGNPKIAVQTHQGIAFNCWSAGQMMDTSLPEFNVYGGLPLFHVFGAMVTLSLCWVGSGHLFMVSPQGFRGQGLDKHFWNIIKHHRINVIAAVPAIYKQLNQAPIPDGINTSLDIALSAAAPLPKGTMMEFEKKTGLAILEGYGCTEATCMVAVNPPYGEKKNGSVGIRIPYTAIKCLIQETTGTWKEAGLNEIGIVAMKGPHVFNGYIDETQNERTWIEFGGERYYNSGDLGRIDEDGYLWLTGRKKELIIRGGHNIDPKSIEEAAYFHPQVEAAAAIGRPDERVGEVPVMYIELKSGANISKQELEEFIKDEIKERAAIPKEIILINEMPMTTIGKIFKPRLMEKEITMVFDNLLQTLELQVGFTIENDTKIGRYVLFNNVSNQDQERILAKTKNYTIEVVFD